MRRAGGFTLLESLAAVIVLGLLAAAVVPLLRNLGQLTLQERMQALVSLGTLAQREKLVPGTTRPVNGHPGWSLVVSELIAEPEPPPPSDRLPVAGPAHRWLLLSIRADAGGSALAETLVAVLDDGGRP